MDCKGQCLPVVDLVNEKIEAVGQLGPEKHLKFFTGRIPVFRHDPKRNRALCRIEIADGVIEKILPVIIAESVAFLSRSGVHPQHQIALEIDRFPISFCIIGCRLKIIIIHGKQKILVAVFRCETGKCS